MAQHQSVAHNKGVLISPTRADINNYEITVRQALERRAVETIGDAESTDDVHVRQILPAADLESGEDNDWDGEVARFTQTGLTGEQDNEVYSIDSRANAQDKILAIVALSNRAGNPLTTQVEFATGNGAIMERLQIEGALTDPEDTILLADPIVYGASQNGQITQYAAEGGDDGLIYHGIVAEVSGNTLEPTTRNLSSIER